MNDIRELIEQDTPLQFAASTKGGEYAGPCPWCGGEDRFRVWPQEGRYWCRGCLKSGDAIQYLRDKRGLSFQEAASAAGETKVYVPRSGIEPTHLPPNEEWRDAAESFIHRAQMDLRESDETMRYLLGRGLSNYTIMEAGLGYNPAKRFDPPEKWGIEDPTCKAVFLPAGLVIPWNIGGKVWRVRIRSLDTNVPKKDRYTHIKGSSNGLYAADLTKQSIPVVLVEGEMDAISLNQSLRSFSGKPIAVAVATGSTTGARIAKWETKLALAPLVLVAYDADEDGDKKAGWWVSLLSNARRWRPLWGDPSQMLQDGVDLKAWIAEGVRKYAPKATISTLVHILPVVAPTAPATRGVSDDPFSPDFPDDVELAS